MKIPSPNAHRKARIEIIPLIDIIFFLLATFVMVSLSMIKNKGISVNLPVAATGTPQERKDFASISITESGDFYFNKEKTDRAGLTEKLQLLKREQPSVKIFINSDAKATFDQVVSVLDEVRKLGLTKIAIETKPLQSPHS